jgi:hypothetical protein
MVSESTCPTQATFWVIFRERISETPFMRLPCPRVMGHLTKKKKYVK